MCVQSFHMVNIDVPAGVGVLPPLQGFLTNPLVFVGEAGVPFLVVAIQGGSPRLVCPFQ